MLFLSFHTNEISVRTEYCLLFKRNIASLLDENLETK